MSQVKTTQIDDLLNQLDRKDENAKKKRIFLVFFFLMLGVVTVFLINSFSGKDSGLASTDKHLNIDNIPLSPAIVVPSVYNNEGDLNEEDLDGNILEENEENEEEESKEEELELESAEDTDSALKNREEKKKEKKETNKTETPIVENNNKTVSLGISNRSFSASKVSNIPLAQTFNEKGPEKISKAEKIEKISEPIIEEKPSEPVVKKVIEEKPNKPIAKEVEPAVVEVDSKPQAAAKKGITKRSSYPGGESKMNAFLARNLSYPSVALDKEIEGNVSVRIRVDENGDIINSEIVKGIGSGCDKEVLKAISKMPKWEPALKNGKPIEQYYMISIAFQLPK